jgi:hypothetical protein
MADKDTKALVDVKAVFVRVPYTSDREKAPGTDSPVPTCKLTSDNPTRDYGVKAYPAFIVADKFGNEFFRIEGKKPTAKELDGYFGSVAKKVDDTSKKLQKSLEAANKSWGNKDRKSALSNTLKAFKDGWVGYEAVEGYKRLYNELMDDARAEITKLADAKDAKALKALKSSLKGTDAEKDADAAIKGLAS